MPRWRRRRSLAREPGRGIPGLAWPRRGLAAGRLDRGRAPSLLNAVVYPVAIVAGSRFRAEGTIKRVAFTATDLAWRAGVVTLCVIVVTTASSSIGSYFSGVFAFFPVAMGSFFVILHPRIGGPATASVAAHVLTPLIGLGLGLLVVHLLAEPVGVWWSYALGLSTGIGWNAMLWLVRRYRLAA